MTATLARLEALDRALVASGWPALSPWWRETFARFVASDRRQLVARVGRRGGKSSSLCRYAVAFALAFDVRQIPPGDLGVVAIISTAMGEAAKRLRTIKAILDALSIPHKPLTEGVGVELVGRLIAFQVFPATVAGVSGFTSILVICDEVAKWKDADTGANPATEVLASVRPTMATQRAARLVLSSSPLGKEDAHARAYAEGDTDRQLTAHAPTWQANPTVTEAETHADEPDLRLWSREYAAEPQAAKIAAFDADAVAGAFERVALAGPAYRPFGVIDASSGKKDTWSWAVARWQAETSAPTASRKLRFDEVDGIGGQFWAHDAGDQIVAKVAAAMRAHGVRTIYGDQRESLMLASAFGRHHLKFVELPWIGPRKERAVMVVRRWLADGVLVLPDHAKLRSELLGFEEKITPSGGLTFAGGRGVSGRDDFVALLLTAAMADSEPKSTEAPPLPGSPSRGMTMADALRIAAERDQGSHETARRLGFDIRDSHDFHKLRRLVGR